MKRFLQAKGRLKIGEMNRLFCQMMNNIYKVAP